MFLLHILQQSICRCQVSCSTLDLLSSTTYFTCWFSVSINTLTTNYELSFPHVSLKFNMDSSSLPFNRYPHQEQDLQHKISLVSYLALNSDYHFNQNFLYKLSIYVYTYMGILSFSHLDLSFSYCRNYHYFDIPCILLSFEGHHEAKTILLGSSYFLS